MSITHHQNYTTFHVYGSALILLVLILLLQVRTWHTDNVDCQKQKRRNVFTSTGIEYQTSSCIHYHLQLTEQIGW